MNFKPNWDALFGIAILVFSLGFAHKKSILNLLKTDNMQVLRILAWSFMLGAFYEFTGLVTGLWVYPAIQISPYYWILALVFWTILGVSIRELFLYLPTHWIISTVSITAFMLITTELFNFLTDSWIYRGPSWILFIFGWITIPVLFYIIPQKIGVFE